MFRLINDQLQKTVQAKTNDVTVLLGARQVGKTTVLKNLFNKGIYINIEKGDYKEILESRDVKKIEDIFNFERKGNSNILILDEVQRLSDPGLVAKVIHDEIPAMRLIISGSSSLEIATKSSESLAGRKKTIIMYPLTYQEKLIQLNAPDSPAMVRESMRYGMYPELLNRPVDKENYLRELVDSAILKDVFYLNLVKNTKNLISLLKLLAYQIGQQINISDLASRVGISRQTVVDYLDILKKTFIVFTLPPFTKKRRDEVGKMEKIYFYDLGIRNSLIEDFSPVEYRADFGSLFENLLISEIMKINDYFQLHYGMYYWRTKWGSEVDLILFKDGKLSAFEIKTRSGSVTSAFTKTYPEAETLVINFHNLNLILLKFHGLLST